VNARTPIAARRSVVILAVIAALLVQAAAIVPVWHELKAGRADFAYLHAAGVELLHGKRAVQQPDRLHPPFELLIFAPLATLPYLYAYIVWYVCNILLLTGVVALLWKNLGGLQQQFAWGLIAVATFYPVLVTLVQGQDSILLLFLLTLCYCQLQKGRELSAGVVLALGMFKFLLVLPILAGLAFARKWRLLAGYLATCGSLLLISIALVGTSGVIRYVRLLLGQAGTTSQGRGDSNIALMPNLRGVLSAFLTERVPPFWITAIWAVLSFGILLLILLRLKGGLHRAVLDLQFALLTTISVVISFHLFSHNAAILVLPLLLLGARSVEPQSGWMRAGLLLSTAVLYACPLVAPMRISMPMFALALMLLFGVLFRALGQTSIGRCALQEPTAEEVSTLRVIAGSNHD
jgi:hypothetical protein